MNSPETNEKNMKKLEETGTVFYNVDDGTDDGGKKSKIDEVTGELPFAFARKAAVGAMFILWAAALVMMLGGGDFRAMLPFLLFSIAAVALLNVPKFIALKKIGDTVIAGFAGAVLLILGIGMLILN